MVSALDRASIQPAGGTFRDGRGVSRSVVGMEERVAGRDCPLCGSRGLPSQRAAGARECCGCLLCWEWADEAAYATEFLGTYIFIAPPSMDVLRDRLVRRGANASDDVERRLAIAEREMSFRDRYDRVVVNHDLNTAVDEIRMPTGLSSRRASSTSTRTTTPTSSARRTCGRSCRRG